MLERCKDEVYPDVEDAEFYVDTRGVPIWSANRITVDAADGTEQEVPWTLATYIQLSNIKYPSKARFYCENDITPKCESKVKPGESQGNLDVASVNEDDGMQSDPVEQATTEEGDVVISSVPASVEVPSLGGEVTIDDIPSMCDKASRTTVKLQDTRGVQLLEVIGQGSYGTVYRAVWRGSVVAAKVMPVSGTECETAARQMESCRQVQHPNILLLLGSVRQDGKLMVVTNLVLGPNLHDLLFDSSHDRLSLCEKLSVAVQICQAVMFIHTANPPLAHLDIKSANILVELPGLHAYLADFGLSKIITGTATVGNRTMLAGSPGFQPPEQLRAESVGVTCDVYAFGGVLAVLFGEQALWPGLTPYQIMHKVTVAEEQPPLAHLPNHIRAICSECLSKCSGRPSAGQVLHALLLYAQELKK